MANHYLIGLLIVLALYLIGMLIARWYLKGWYEELKWAWANGFDITQAEHEFYIRFFNTARRRRRTILFWPVALRLPAARRSGPLHQDH